MSESGFIVQNTHQPPMYRTEEGQWSRKRWDEALFGSFDEALEHVLHHRLSCHVICRVGERVCAEFGDDRRVWSNVKGCPAASGYGEPICR